MKLVKSLAILLLVFAAGLVVGGWSSEIVRIVKVWLGLPGPLLSLKARFLPENGGRCGCRYAW
jgi:hypothetical protein